MTVKQLLSVLYGSIQLYGCTNAEYWSGDYNDTPMEYREDTIRWIEAADVEWLKIFTNREQE